MGPTVSIIVPCYNAEGTLAETLDSVLAQSSVALEIVVIDDGSNDGSLAVARRFEPPARVITGPNRGASAARNTGILETSADWLVFLDADDILLPGTLIKRLETACETNADVVVCDWQDFSGEPEECPRPGRSIDWAAVEIDAERAIATGVWATTAACMYRRSLVKKIGGLRADLPIIQDARFFFDAAHHGARIVQSRHIGAKYRIVPGSLSRRAPAQFWLDVFLNGQQIEALWRAKGTLDLTRLQALAGIYNNAARGLFSAGHPDYFKAVEAQRQLGLPLPRHSLVAPPLARIIGLDAARTVLGFVT